MFELPQPLHPALVHFPIVLIILGTVAAVFSLVLDRWHIREWTAVLLVLAALGAVAATWSGGDQAREVRPTLSPAVKQLLHNHAEWGETTRNVTLAAAALAVIALALQRLPRLALAVRLILVLVALGATWSVIQTGHFGGEMVYHQGVGTSKAASP